MAFREIRIRRDPAAANRVDAIGKFHFPQQYDGWGTRRFPGLYDLVGFTGSGLAHTACRMDVRLQFLVRAPA